MVEILEMSTNSCVVARLGGMVKGDEYQVFLDAVDERLAASESIDLVVDISELEFYGDLKAAREDLRFGVKEFRKVRRCAFVGDQKWIDLFIKVSGPFYQAEERRFAAGALDEAIAWATS